MNAFYRCLEISKQAFHQYKNRKQIIFDEQEQLLFLIAQIRKDHPTMGLRDMYFKLQPNSLGRDAFEVFCKRKGLGLQRIKNHRRTTDSTGVKRFENLLTNLEINKVNQVWQSDITYFEVNGRFYYITFIIDAYSRTIVGHSVSPSLFTIDTTIPALEKAIRFRNMKAHENRSLIFHSDGGGQYYAKKFLQLTSTYNITSSMCEYAWENGKAERINGVIKNNYLVHKEISSIETLKKEVDRSVFLYNHEKPHIGLQRKTPIEFETSLGLNKQVTIAINKGKGSTVVV